MAYFAESHPTGGVRLFELMLDEERGVLGFELYQTSRSQARRFLREMTRRDRYPAVEASPPAVRALVERIVSRHSANRPPPRGFSEWRSHFASGEPSAAAPGVLAREALGAESAGDGLERAAALVRSGDIGPWPPPVEGLRVVSERLEAIGVSSLVISGQSRREQVAGVLEGALAEIFTPEFTEVTRYRLDETAYVLWKTDREDEARACLAGAASLCDSPPGANPLARAFLETVLAPVLAKLEDEPEAPGGAPLVGK
jgi:hypothetical protein